MLERRSHFVLDDFDPRPVADDIATGLDGFALADFHADRSVEFQGPAASRRFRVAEHDADFFAELVDEDDDGFGLGNDARQFAQGLAHEAGLEADVGIAHFPFDFRFRDQGGYGADDNDVDGAAADEFFRDFQGLFAIIGLGNEQFIRVDAEVAGIDRIQGVFGIDESGNAAALLSRGDGMQGQGRLA